MVEEVLVAVEIWRHGVNDGAQKPLLRSLVAKERRLLHGKEARAALCFTALLLVGSFGRLAVLALLQRALGCALAVAEAPQAVDEVVRLLRRAEHELRRSVGEGMRKERPAQAKETKRSQECFVWPAAQKTAGLK